MPIQEFRADLLPKIRQLDVGVRRKVLNALLTGNLATRFRGSGYEFETYRSYLPTDDAAKIDWKAYLRSHKLLVREYDMERNFFVFILVDASNSMLCSSTDKLKCEFAAEVASSLCFSMLELDAGVGYGMFTDKMIVKSRPEQSKKQYFNFIRELTNVNNYGGEYNLGDVLKSLIGFLRSQTYILVISDFLGLDDNWFRYMQILSQKYQVDGIMIRDPRDRSLPKDSGQYVLQDPYTNETIYVDVNQYAKAYEEYVMQEEQTLKRKFELAKAGLLSLSTDRPYMDHVVKFFKERSREWR